MDRRLKIITIALSMVYVASIGRFIYYGAADFVYGAKLGLQAGIKMAETGEAPSWATIGTFFLSLKPENGLRTFPTTMRNQLDRKPMNAEIERMVVEISEVKNRQPGETIATFFFTSFLSCFALFILALVPLQTFRVLRSVSKDKIFDPTNIRKLRSIGYALLAFYIANLVVNFFHYRIATQVVQVDGYSLQFDWGNITLVLLGFVVLMFAEVLKVSVQLKEEQALTV